MYQTIIPPGETDKLLEHMYLASNGEKGQTRYEFYSSLLKRYLRNILNVRQDRTNGAHQSLSSYLRECWI